MEIPEKSPVLRVHSEEPLNIETPPSPLREGFVTPVERFFVRSHGSLPRIEPGDYFLSVSGLVEHALDLTLEDLESSFPRTEMTASLHCAGNRRAELMRVHPIPGETPWDIGAIGNARWTGVRLREVLAAAGVREGAGHVAFAGLDEVSLEDGTTHFGGSITLEKALGDDVILAYEMNGEPLSTAHGYPLRAVVAGYIGARSVKWLSGVEVRRGPSDNHFQARDYRLYPADMEPGEPDPAEGEPLGDLSVNSVICRPEEGETVPAGPVEVAGYAITGGGRAVETVEVSADGGETWNAAKITQSVGTGAWAFWEARIEPGPAGSQSPEIRLLARARDASGSIQPASPRQTWNPKGYVNNAYHRVNVRRSGG